MTTAMSAQPIPTPPDFPVTWERAEDAQLFWQPDPLHFPEPMHPLEFDCAARGFAHGFNGAAEANDVPIRAELRRINGYFFQCFHPPMVPHEELMAMAQRFERRAGELMGRLGERWHTEQLPEIQRNLAAMRGFDLAGASLTELIRHWDRTVAFVERTWYIHFDLALPMLLAMSMFNDVYADLFGAENALDAYRLLQGFDNKSLETDRALWALSRTARAVPFVREVLTWSADHEVVPLLEQRADGQAFLRDLNAFLAEYGRRSDTFAIIGVPGWIEDPTPVIKNLRDYITRDDYDPMAEMQRLADEREQVIAETRARLQGYPQPVVGQFEFFLKAAQEATVLQEDHNFWLDQRSLYEVRRVAQELGRRFAEAGVIEHADDVFYLTIDEVRQTAETLPWMDRRQRVAQRRAEMEHFRRIAPPPAVGTPPPGAPPDNPLFRAITRFFGGPMEPAAAPNELRGNAGSAGVVRGVAKVVRSLAEAGKLRQGDILVTATTAPPWTPLFATAAAVVTDAGGILSHCAVVAREYRIPAVVGTGMATTLIRDGQILEVDGSAGIVRLIDEL
jgi:phosphohistidine swiveling domain-containing protein